jgi:hypothetical protein
MNRSGAFRLLVGLALCIAITTPLPAQSIYGALRGAITDGQGAAVGGAKVTITDEATNNTRWALSNDAGEYNFASVIPATYTVTTEAPGFKKSARTGIVVATQQYLTLDIGLEIGAVSESVMVTAETVALETSNASEG